MNDMEYMENYEEGFDDVEPMVSIGKVPLNINISSGKPKPIAPVKPLPSPSLPTKPTPSKPSSGGGHHYNKHWDRDRWYSRRHRRYDDWYYPTYWTDPWYYWNSYYDPIISTPLLSTPVITETVNTPIGGASEQIMPPQMPSQTDTSRSSFEIIMLMFMLFIVILAVLFIAMYKK